MPTRPARARHHRRIVAWAVALTATLTLSATACGGDDDPGPTADDATTTTAKTTTTTVPPEKLPTGHFIDLQLPDDLTAEEKEVAEAYRDALEAFARAQTNPSAGLAQLEEHVQGPALVDAQDLLERYAEDRTAARFADQASVVVIDKVRVDGETALIGTCLHDQLELYDTRTGKTTSSPVPDADSVTELVRRANTWVVNRAEPGEERSKESPCAA